MVGICGIIGKSDYDIEEMLHCLSHTGMEYCSSTDSRNFSGGIVAHDLITGDQPVETEQYTVCLWGEIFGCDNRNYKTRPRGISSEEFFIQLYQNYGEETFAKLNGEFAGVVFDKSEQTGTLFTDRLGSRAIYYSETKEGNIAFSTNIHSLFRVPELKPVFDIPYLHEFLNQSIGGVLGIVTPLQDINQIHPGCYHKFDSQSKQESRQIYFTPNYSPKDKPYQYFKCKFREVFKNVISERTREDVSYGQMITGGSDSRLLLSMINKPVRAYHIAQYLNPEARIAERLSFAADADFQLLRRTPEYTPQTLELNSTLSNFDGYHTQAFTTGFKDEIAEHSDIVLSAQFADTFFKGYFIPQLEVPIWGGDSISLPIEEKVSNLDEYVDKMYNPGLSPDYLKDRGDMRDILMKDISSNSNYRHHEVYYPSFTELLYCGDYYPLTNQHDYLNHIGLTQIMPHRNPFLDNRLIDLHLSMPIKYLLRRNIIDDVVSDIAPDLAKLPHSNSQISIDHSFYIKYIAQKTFGFYRKYSPIKISDTPKSAHRRISAPKYSEIYRENQDFYESILVESESAIIECEFLDKDEIWRYFDEHQRGDDNHAKIFDPLFTFLNILEMNDRQYI